MGIFSSPSPPASPPPPPPLPPAANPPTVANALVKQAGQAATARAKLAAGMVGGAGNSDLKANALGGLGSMAPGAKALLLGGTA